MSDLSGHAALITGSTQGVGLEIAAALHQAGAQVLLHGLIRDQSAIDATLRCETDGNPATLITGDLAEPMPDGPLAVADAAIHHNPQIDLLVCNAGTFIDTPFPEEPFEIFDKTMKLNVYSHWVMIQRFVQHWRENQIRGRILMTGSINGRLAEPVHVAYDTSKAAIEGMLRSLCVTLAPMGIRINGMAPGLFRTPLTEPALQDPRVMRWMQLHTPSGEVPNADVCGGAAVFLLSDAAEHIHGQMLLVDGGMSVWQQPDPPSDWMNSSMASGS